MILLIFSLIIEPINANQTILYTAASTNAPHGCPNYGLCALPRTRLIRETNTTKTYQYYCNMNDCVCLEGTVNGTLPCDTITEKCDPDPCRHDVGKFECISLITGPSCECQLGFTGKWCNHEVGTACSSSPCLNGGHCETDDAFGYVCTCADGFTGDNCEIVDWCKQVNCQHGTCQMVLDGRHWYCECEQGWQGRLCDQSTLIQLPANKSELCFYLNTVELTLQPHKYQDKKRQSVSKCQQFAESTDPPSSYLTLCGNWCAASEEPFLNETAPIDDGDGGEKCNRPCGGDPNQICGERNQRCVLYHLPPPLEDPNGCNSSTACNSSAVCVDLPGSKECLCPIDRTGPTCDEVVESACDTSNACVNGTCILNTQTGGHHCDCDEGFTGEQCDIKDPCKPNPCRYGGTCHHHKNSYQCQCLPMYHGIRCQEVNRCEYSNPCVHGQCEPRIDGIRARYVCRCEEGWTGTNCDRMVDLCEDEPCQYNSTCTPEFRNYKCDCIPGTKGRNCEHIIDQCVGFWQEGQWIPSPCNTKDEGANCTTGINTFTCNCTAQWTESLCDLNVLIKDVLLAIYGYVDTNMIGLLNDLMSNPSQIKDMVPFITGLLSLEERIALSWEAADLFEWVAFEDERLDYNTELFLWNDIVLGNCFTFNHVDLNMTFLMRSPGRHGGLHAYIRARQDEYAPWYDTASINVFIHNRDDYVFSESVRYNSEPNSASAINIFNTKYTRLGGKYGKCIKETNEVDAYYYPGSYSTDGCLRTCYQDRIKEECGCMDPRYPTADNETLCELSERNCVQVASERAGDPSTWESCVCPLPCSNAQYSVTWSKANIAHKQTECDDDCRDRMEDAMRIRINLPQLDFKIYSESPAMDFNKFLSQLGGQLGMLMGINLVSFIEIIFLIFELIYICSQRYN